MPSRWLSCSTTYGGYTVGLGTIAPPRLERLDQLCRRPARRSAARAARSDGSRTARRGRRAAVAPRSRSSASGRRRPSSSSRNRASGGCRRLGDEVRPRCRRASSATWKMRRSSSTSSARWCGIRPSCTPSTTTYGHSIPFTRCTVESVTSSPSRRPAGGRVRVAQPRLERRRHRASTARPRSSALRSSRWLASGPRPPRSRVSSAPPSPIRPGPQRSSFSVSAPARTSAPSRSRSSRNSSSRPVRAVRARLRRPLEAPLPAPAIRCSTSRRSDRLGRRAASRQVGARHGVVRRAAQREPQVRERGAGAGALEHLDADRRVGGDARLGAQQLDAEQRRPHTRQHRDLARARAGVEPRLRPARPRRPRQLLRGAGASAERAGGPSGFGRADRLRDPHPVVREQVRRGARRCRPGSGSSPRAGGARRRGSTGRSR